MITPTNNMKRNLRLTLMAMCLLAGLAQAAGRRYASNSPTIDPDVQSMLDRDEDMNAILGRPLIDINVDREMEELSLLAAEDNNIIQAERHDIESNQLLAELAELAATMEDAPSPPARVESAAITREMRVAKEFLDSEYESLSNQATRMLAEQGLCSSRIYELKAIDDALEFTQNLKASVRNGGLTTSNLNLMVRLTFEDLRHNLIRQIAELRRNPSRRTRRRLGSKRKRKSRAPKKAATNARQPVSPVTRKAITNCRNTVDQWEKKIQKLNQRCEELLSEASRKKAAGDKDGAKWELKTKKLLLKQIAKIKRKQQTLEATIDKLHE